MPAKVSLEHSGQRPHPKARRDLRRPGLALIALLTAGLLGAQVRAQAQAQVQTPRRPAPVNGVVIGVRGQTLQLQGTDDNAITVDLAANAQIIAQVPATLAAVKQGRFIGTTAVKEADGQLHAREIHVFPESMRGAGEGHYPMGAPNTTMTNGDLESVNGNVEQSALGERDTRPGLVMRVDYKGGQSLILVPPDVTVTMMRVGNRTLLKPGAHVTVLTARSGGSTPTAGTVIVHMAGAPAPAAH
jgi:hypothetical protein